MGTPEERRQLERSFCRKKNTIKMDFQDVRWGIKWIDLAEDRDRWLALVNVVMKFRKS